MVTNTNVISCPRCGAPAAAGKRYCGKCGGALAGVGALAGSAPPVAIPAPPAPPAPVAARAPAAPFTGPRKGLSIWWLVIPTAAYVALQVGFAEQKSWATAVIAVAIAGGLYWWKQQPAEKVQQQLKSMNLPPGLTTSLQRIQPFAYMLQIGIIFVMLGGAIAAIALAAVVAFVLWVAKNPQGVVQSLEPWWKFQEQIPPGLRKVLAFAVPGVTGYLIASSASGIEWGATLISVAIGACIGFLFIFTPPAWLRQRQG
jgi:hypothetical protein